MIIAPTKARLQGGHAFEEMYRGSLYLCPICISNLQHELEILWEGSMNDCAICVFLTQWIFA